MFRYPDIYRIPVEGYTRRGKKYLSVNEVHDLLDGRIEVEEKIDGKRIRTPVDDYIVFREDCKRRHTISYMTLPSWEIGFDVWDGKKFLNYDEKKEVLDILDIPIAPLVFRGIARDLSPLLRFIGLPSAFGSKTIEGIVIKNREKQLFGKIIDPQFDQEIDETGHHLRRPYERNRLDTAKVIRPFNIEAWGGNAIGSRND